MTFTRRPVLLLVRSLAASTALSLPGCGGVSGRPVALEDSTCTPSDAGDASCPSTVAGGGAGGGSGGGGTTVGGGGTGGAGGGGTGGGW